MHFQPLRRKSHEKARTETGAAPFGRKSFQGSKIALAATGVKIVPEDMHRDGSCTIQ